MEVIVQAGEHANLDSLPLRYGFSYDQDTIINLTSVEKTETQKNGRIRVLGRFTDSSGDCGAGTFIVDINDPRGNILVTVWKNEDRYTEEGLSDTMKSLREAKLIRTQNLINWHPRYLDGRLTSKDDLLEIILEEFQPSNELIGKLNQEKDRLQSNLWNADYEVEQLSEENDQLSERNRQLEEAAQKRILEADLSNSIYRGEVIETSDANTLAKVERGKRKKYNGDTVECTYLHFAEETVGVRIMDKWADQTGEITTVAEGLIGRRVITSTWKPEIFPPDKWFRNIEVAD